VHRSVHTAMRNCTETKKVRRVRLSGVDRKPPQAAVVKSQDGERCGKGGTGSRQERRSSNTAAPLSSSTRLYSVISTPCELRSSNRRSIVRSNSAIDLEMAGWVVLRSAAALSILPACTTVIRYGGRAASPGVRCGRSTASRHHCRTDIRVSKHSIYSSRATRCIFAPTLAKACASPVWADPARCATAPRPDRRRLRDEVRRISFVRRAVSRA